MVPARNRGLRAHRGVGACVRPGGRCGRNPFRRRNGRTSYVWVSFTSVYVLSGRVVFEYEGEGEHVLRAGSCVLQPPGIRRREVRHSEDLELVEIVSPAEFTTHDAEALI